MEYDTKKILKRIDKEEYQKRKIDEMFNIKHELFEYIHFRVGESKMKKVGWYKRRWGYEIKQYYFGEDRKVIGDIERIIGKLKTELERVKFLSDKQFRSEFYIGLN
jgi:hypothetical protein